MLHTEQQKRAYPMFEISGRDDALHLVHYEIDWDADVNVPNR